MSRSYLAAMAVACVTAATIATSAQAQRPQIQTTKVDGTDNVYIFRNGNHQSMFVVTKDGVIATDPIAYGRPTGGQHYVDEIKKVTDKPIKYLIYSHHHYDHIAGGKAFKDAGATHHRAPQGQGAARAARAIRTRVLPDETVDDKPHPQARRHHARAAAISASTTPTRTLVMRLPKEKIIFVVDTIPVGPFPGRGMIDIYPLETEAVHQEGAGDGLGAADPRPPRRPTTGSAPRRTRRTAHADAGRLGRGEERGAGRQVLGRRRRRSFKLREIRELARL